MPLYEYLCDACAHRFEVIQKFSDAPIEVCPKCGGRVQKVLSSPAIQFKGSGWYITDYARKSSADAGKSSESAGEKADKAGEKADAAKKSGATDAGASSTSAPAPSSSSTPSKE